MEQKMKKSGTRNIRKDMIKEYGEEFIQNYSLFKQGELCFLHCPLLNEPGAPVTYVYEGQVFNFDGTNIISEDERNDVQVFFDHPPVSYWKYNIAQHVDEILGTMLEGKDWTVKNSDSGNDIYRYRDGKFYQMLRGYLFNSWTVEHELTKSQIIVRILQYLKKEVKVSVTEEDKVSSDVNICKADIDVTEEEETPMENSTVILKKKDCIASSYASVASQVSPIEKSILRRRH
jgi:hypothetical protein